MPIILPRVRRLASLLLIAACALTSCGGGEAKPPSVANTLDQAFRQPIDSADLSVEVELDLGGDTAARPVRIEASGPFRGNGHRLPLADIDVRIATEGTGQTIQTGFLFTGDRAFVKFQEAFYEQPAPEVRRATRQMIRTKRRGGPLGALGLDARSWLGPGLDGGRDEVQGVQTRQISGTLRAGVVVRDLNRFVSRSGAVIGGAIGQAAPAPLTAEEVAQLSRVIEEPTFDVYVGDYGFIRRVSGRVEFEVPEAERDGEGIESGSLTFSIELSDVNGDQLIEPPARARPLSALTRTLGGDPLDSLSADGGEQVEPPAAPGEDEDSEQLRDYEECLEKERPADTDALQRCADVLAP